MAGIEFGGRYFTQRQFHSVRGAELMQGLSASRCLWRAFAPSKQPKR
jgi:hypothetical protein